MKTHDTTLQQLRDAIISMKPERLQKILPLMCEERPECVPIFVNYFLVNEKPNPNKRLKKEVCVKNEDDGIKKEEDIDAEEVKDHRGQATDAVVSESESSEESAADDRPKEYAGQRWEECRRCGEDYDVTRNSHGICKWHDGSEWMKAGELVRDCCVGEEGCRTGRHHPDRSKRRGGRDYRRRLWKAEIKSRNMKRKRHYWA